MSKLSQTLRTAPGVSRRRLIMMSVALVAVAAALGAAIMGGSPAAPDTRKAPVDEAAGVRAAVTPETDGFGMKLAAAEASAPAQKPTAPAAAPTTSPAASAPPADAPEEPTTPPPPPEGATGTLTDSEAFSLVQDGKKITFEESPAYNLVVQRAWERAQGKLNDQPVSVNRVELLTHPEKYRGRALLVHGQLVRVKPVKYNTDPKHPERPLQHYECAIMPADEGLYMVLTFENPLDAGIRPGVDVVTTVGYFYKVWGYDRERQQAPLLMGARLRKVVIRDVVTPAYTVALAVVVLVIIVAWAVLSKRGKSNFVVRRKLSHEEIEQLDIPEPAELPRDKREQTPPNA